MFFVEFLPTQSCNQSCSYCDISNSHRNIHVPIEMDLDYFKYCVNALGKYTDNLMIEICGGEPGLISNLTDAMIFLKDHKSVAKTQIMSNGLIRKDQPHLLQLVDSYNEHLINNINDKFISKFYDMDFESYDNTRYVIVLNESTTNSLLHNYDHFHQLGLFNEDKFWLKMFVERSTPNNHKQQLIELFTKIGSDYAKYSIKQLGPINKFNQRVCSMFPWLPVINLETKKIVHCAYHNFSNSIEFDITDFNLKSLIEKRLFLNYETPEYCENCYLYDNDPMFAMKRNKSNRR